MTPYKQTPGPKRRIKKTPPRVDTRTWVSHVPGLEKDVDVIVTSSDPDVVVQVSISGHISTLVSGRRAAPIALPSRGCLPWIHWAPAEKKDEDPVDATAAVENPKDSAEVKPRRRYK